MDIAKMTVVYRVPGMDEVEVRRGIEYQAGEAGTLSLDVYHPAGTKAGIPVVVIVLGYPDVGVPLVFGGQFRELGPMTSWARLLAASGMAAVLYETRDPARDAGAVVSYLRANATALGIDATRIGVWASSGNVPVALSLLMDGGVRCGVLCYGFLLDLDGAAGVANAARAFRFANATAGRRVEDLPADTAVFLARAGQDQFAGLNEGMDGFVAAALRRNLAVTVVNHATGVHAFDLVDEGEASREVVRMIVEFLRTKLGA